MSATEWKIAKPGTCCAACKALFQPGAEYVSTLMDLPKAGAGSEGGDFQRSDFCGSCFEAHPPAELLYYWKTTVPQHAAGAGQKPSRVVMDLDHVLEFFKRLEGESARQKVAFRYVLALVLSRKKVLLPVGQRKDADGRPLQVYKEKGSAQEHAVIEPDLSAEELAGLSDDLGAVLGLPVQGPPRAEAQAASS